MSLLDLMVGPTEEEVFSAIERNKTPADEVFRLSMRYELKKGISYAIKKGAAKYPSLLAYCARQGRLDEVRLLLDEGADIHAKNNKALCESVFQGKIEVVRYLIERGADVNSPLGKPLLIALQRGRNEMIDLLRSKGADLKIIPQKKIQRILPFLGDEVKELLMNERIIPKKDH